MRLFIAVDFPKEFKEEIVKAILPLTSVFPQVFWTKKENVHLTIKFLGNIKKNFKFQSASWRTNFKLKNEDDYLQRIKLGIQTAIERIEPFEFVFDKLGFFEKEQLIIWLGADTNPDITLLIERLDRELAELGFPIERRIFTPHMTIGRGKHVSVTASKAIKDVILKQDICIKPFTVREITLVNSTLTPSGPIYTPLAKFALYSKSYIISDT